jgi:hypothetical protein
MEDCQNRRTSTPASQNRTPVSKLPKLKTKVLCKDGGILRTMNRKQSGVARAEVLLLLLAVAIFLAGAVRYYIHGGFTLAQAGYCLLSIPAALLALLVFDYTLHHARIAAVMVVVFVSLSLVASPAFCIGMGLALAGMVRGRGR